MTTRQAEQLTASMSQRQSAKLLADEVCGVKTEIGALNHQLGRLREAFESSSASTTKLASALNRLTALYVLLTGIGVGVAIYQTFFRHA